MSVPTVGLLTAAILVSVGNADLERALSLGRRPEAERARFHAAYVFALNDATVEQIEVITEFRRAVIVVEDRAKFGDYMFGVRQLESAVRPFHDQVTIRARLRFHPMNTLPGIPDYEVRVGAPDDRLLALGPTARSPIYVQSGKKETQALMGAHLEIAYDSGIVGQNRYPVSVVLDGRTIASTPIDFARLE